MSEVKNITKTYGSGDTAFQALKGISLSVFAGEIVALIGANGAGKTSTLKSIARILTPSLIIAFHFRVRP